MVAVWPVDLPQSPLVGFREGIGDGRRKSETDTGPGKMLGRSSAVVGHLSGTMLMTKQEVTALIAFVEDDLDRGSLPFEIPRPRNPANADLVRFAPDGLPSWRCVVPGIYEVQLDLEILP